MSQGLNQILLFILLIHVKLGIAQENIWHQIGTEQGLPNATVICFQDLVDGRIAMGTPEGLIIFDGVSYQKIIPPSKKEMSINPFINKMVLAKNGHLWIATRNSIWLHNIYSNKTEIYQDTNLLLRGALDIDLQGDFVYALFQNGYFKFEANNETFNLIDIKYANQNHYSFHINSSESVDYYVNQFGITRKIGDKVIWECRPPNLIDASYDKFHKAWLLLSKKGAFYIKENTCALIKLPYQLNFELADHSDNIFSDQQGKIWFSLSSALYEYDGLFDSIPNIHISDKTNKNTIPYNSANCGLTQKNGVTWLGGSAGSICYTNKTENGIKVIPHQQIGAGFIWSIFKDKEKLLLGCADGLVVANFKNQKLQDLKTIKQKKGERFTVSSIGNFDADNYIIGTYNKQCFLLNKQTLLLKKFETPAYLGSCQGIIPLSKNRLLFQGTGNFAIYSREKKVFTPKIAKPDNLNVLSACEDNKGNIWIASGIGLTKLNPQLIFDKQYTYQKNDTLSLPGNVIIHIYETKDGSMYLGSMGNGLIEFNPLQEVAKQIPLSGNPINVYGILEVDHNNLIISSSAGLILFNKSNKTSKALNKSNILPFNDFSQLAYYKDQDYFYFGGENALILLPRVGILEKFSEKIVLAVRHHGNLINTLELPSNKRNINLQIGPQISQILGDVKYQFRLKNKEENWHELPPKQNNIVYNYLPAGSYILEARLVDENNYYETSAIELNILIESYFYETWWFILLIIILALFLISILFKYFGHIQLKRKLQKLEAEQKVAMERIRISRELHDNVGSQLSYLISGLEASEIYLKKNNEELLSKNIEQLQESARESMQQLRDSIWAYNRDAMTIENMAEQFGKWYHKICSPHLQLRANLQINYSANYTIDPLSGLNLFRIMQEAVNNALKHANATQLSVNFKEEKSTVLIQIADNGIGFNENNKIGNGMQSMEERAKEIGATLSISSNPRKGTFIEVIYLINTTKS